MDKRWYPVAFTMTISACGGDVDEGRPTATGGAPVAYYGPAFVSGGTTGTVTGLAGFGGGFYGPKSWTGGAGTGGSEVSSKGSGGASGIDTGVPESSGGEPIIIYMANLRLPNAQSAEHAAIAFEPKPGGSRQRG